MREIIVTGGAGYIGSHIAQEFLDVGCEVHVIDNLQTGHLGFVPSGVHFHRADVASLKQLSQIFAQLKDAPSAGVVHAAGLKFAGESIKAPLEFYNANTNATIQLLIAMSKFKVSNLVFSSSSSVYGQHGANGPVVEDSELVPISPYGRSKLFAEQIINDAKIPFGINSVALRYFNVIGSRPECGLDLSKFNLLPNLYRAISSNHSIQVFGDSYATPDGTCIRDYVDVRQLAKAHVRSLELLSLGEDIPSAINVGSGSGFSVREIIDVLQMSTGKYLNIEVVSGRKGDPAITLADTSVAKEFLKWDPFFTVQESIASGWESWEKMSNLFPNSL
jgi:UDP-glucose 4-epimerase